jgi:ABC-2 type transport system permease protein
MNMIRNSLRLARKDLKILFKDRGQLVVLFVLPLVFALLLGGPHAAMRDPVTTSGESRLSIKAYCVNEDQGPYGAQVEEVLRSIKPLRMLRSRSVDHADEKVASGEAPAAIIIPADFSARIDANQPARIQLIKDPAQQAEAQAVAGILKEVLAELSVRAEIEYGIRAVFDKTGALQGADPEAVRAAQAQTMGVIWTAVQEIRQNPAIAVQREDLTSEERVLTVSGVVFSVWMPLFSTMFAFFLVGFMAESILKEKEAGSFRRLLAAPIHRSTVIAGKMLAFIGVVFLQMLVLFGIGSAFFQMPLGDSPLGLLALTLALALAATSLGMLVGSLARTSKQAGNIGMLLGFVLYFASGYLNATINISGSVADVSFFHSEGFRFYLSQLTPHAHAINGYLKLMLEGAGLVDILPNILALLVFSVIFLLLAMWRFKFD